MNAIELLIQYAQKTGLIEACEKNWAVNTVLDTLQADSEPEIEVADDASLSKILDALCDDAFARGVLKENSVVYRDLFDTEIMGRLTPRPAQVAEKFAKLYQESPEAATNWYYRFSQDTNYIRRDRIAKDIQWKAPTEYGELDITINLSKPEKDPKAIAAARNLPASNYPRCLLCSENEGYAGRVNHPAVLPSSPRSSSPTVSISPTETHTHWRKRSSNRRDCLGKPEKTRVPRARVVRRT